MFHIVLYQPEIPQNTGNIARTCAVTGCKLHLIKPMAFQLDDKKLKRAGLDYWDKVFVDAYDGFDAFLKENPGLRLHFFSTKGKAYYHQAHYRENDCLVFGKETAGLPEALLAQYHGQVYRLPMREDLRSLNLSNTVCTVVYEGLRQNSFPHMI
ncbi:tRNA (cytidine(34)-2'-O)-methyltransferase [Eubacteriales bacterium OttesenSCG-928-M02]|nr:tRNA (cytidine(34)-2'-O)-methyltransferase [Eubacteriales bacterium OttesenSCG-928-M02]